MSGFAALALCLGSLLSALFVYRFVKFTKSENLDEGYAYATAIVGILSAFSWLFVSDYVTGVLMVIFMALAAVSMLASFVHIAILD